jgi:thymidylate kinase
MTAVHSAAAPRHEEPADQPLDLVSRLIRRLAQEQVRYCHWKSNEHLGAALAGATDLDLLVDHEAAALVTQLLVEVGFKRFTAPSEITYVGVEDYLGLDEETGRLAHVHLHYRLVLGEKFLKGYRLPWEDTLLASRRVDSASGMYVCDPSLELLLLLLRAAIKLRRRDRLSARRRRLYASGDFEREYVWLVARMSRERLGNLAHELVGPEAAAVVTSMVPEVPSTAQLLDLRRAVAPVLDRFRTFDRRGADLQRWRREWRSRSGRALRRYLGIRVPIGFTVPRGGVMVAFVGADGSGKSTVVRAVSAWLAWRLETVPVYLGFGDGRVSLSRSVLQTLARVWTRSTKSRSDTPSPVSAEAPTGLSHRTRTAWRVLWAGSIVREKQARMRQAVRARNLGQVVICDRYPQAQIEELGDGPLLGRLEVAPAAWRSASRWELKAYQQMEAIAPDLVVKLHVSPEVSARRKRDVSLESLRQRVEVVQKLRFARATRVVEIDSDQPLDQVLLQVKRAVWDAL